MIALADRPLSAPRSFISRDGNVSTLRIRREGKLLLHISSRYRSDWSELPCMVSPYNFRDSKFGESMGADFTA